MNNVKYLLSMAVLAAMSSGAQAYNPATQAYAANAIIRVSGASAVDNALFDRVDQDMCQNNANKSYLFLSGKGVGNLGDYWGITCDATAASGYTAGTPILFLKRAAGGSGQGVGPVNSSTAIQFLNRTTCAGGPTSYTCTAGGADVPNGGLSDVYPKAFEDPINGGTGAAYNNLDATTLATQVFGVVVTKDLRNALQAMEFGETSPCATSVDESVKEGVECMPSLSHQQVRSIFAVDGGALSSWDNLQFINPTTGVAEGLASSPVTAAYRTAADFDPLIHICRRIRGSGTQAQFQYEFLDNPSKNAVNGSLVPFSESGSDFFGGPVVWNGSGSSDTEDCLVAYQSGTTKSIIHLDLNDPTELATVTSSINNDLDPHGIGDHKVHAWAIGLMGTEKNNKLQKDYRFVKLDGNAPTIDSVAVGNYTDAYEASCQVRKNDNSLQAGFVKKACALTAATIKKLDIGANGTIEVKGDGVGEHVWGVAGYLAPSTNTGAVPDAIFSFTNPVTNYVRDNNAAKGLHINPAYNTVVPFYRPWWWQCVQWYFTYVYPTVVHWWPWW